jgi:hypothetical protein
MEIARGQHLKFGILLLQGGAALQGRTAPEMGKQYLHLHHT